MSAPADSTPQAPTTRPLQIGVLHENVQTTDLAGLDILGNLTPETLSLVTTLLPQFKPLLPYSTPMTFHYLAPTLTPQPSTPSMSIVPTHTYATAPRDLDILVLGGPDPNTVSEESLAFLREACEHTKTVMTTCTGAMWLAKSGVLNGKRATTNRVCLAIAKAMFPEVEWVDQRWVVQKVGDREIWTAGGAGCGIDMFIEYANQHFNKTLVELSCQGLDFEYNGRSQEYTKALKTEV